MNPLIIASAVSAAVSGVAGFGLAWQLQSGNIAELENDYANTRMAEQRAAHAVKERQLDAVIKAQNNGAARVAVLRRESDSARSDLDRLRTSSDNAMRAAATDAATCNRVATAYGVVFAECSNAVQTLATDIGQCSSANQTLTDSWPR